MVTGAAEQAGIGGDPRPFPTSRPIGYGLISRDVRARAESARLRLRNRGSCCVFGADTPLFAYAPQKLSMATTGCWLGVRCR